MAVRVMGPRVVVVEQPEDARVPRYPACPAQVGRVGRLLAGLYPYPLDGGRPFLAFVPESPADPGAGEEAELWWVELRTVAKLGAP